MLLQVVNMQALFWSTHATILTAAEKQPFAKKMPFLLLVLHLFGVFRVSSGHPLCPIVLVKIVHESD